MRLTITALAALALAAASGCGGRTLPGSPTDDGGVSDGAPWKRDQPGMPDALPPGCTNCRDYVLSQILIPRNASDAKKYSLLYKGKAFNAFGQVVALLAAQAPSIAVPDSVSHSVNKGKAVLLMRLQADSLVNDPTVSAQLWIGAETQCCSSTWSPDQCAKQAAARCFNGKATFKVHPSSPTNLILPGSIQGGRLTLGPGKLKLRMTMSRVTTDLPLKYGGLRGAVSDATISGGVLSGAISTDTVSKVVIPQIAAMLHQTLQTADHKTRQMIRQLFDVNHDGKITASEVANNALIKTFLAGDVDVDGDGVRELSVGMGYSAVRAKILN